MEDLIKTIEEIVKYGLNPNVEVENKKRDLEKNLVRLYAHCFTVDYESDDNEYTSFEQKRLYPNVIENVRKNFQNFGWYHTVMNLEEILKEPENGIGDAVDDLADIIYDLLEVKWRKENNSNNDAQEHFEIIFDAHTQQHLINLLNYMKNN